MSLGFNPERNSFHTIAENLKKFQYLSNSLSHGLLHRCNQYETSNELSSKFVEKKAVFHKSCIARYNKQKLERKRKREESSEDNVAINELSELSAGDTPSRRTTRRSFEIRNFIQSCFFCGLNDDQTELHQCRTLEIHKRVKKFATVLGDSKLLAKLSEGDMVAIESKYHKHCLIKFYNHHRDHMRSLNSKTAELELVKGILYS